VLWIHASSAARLEQSIRKTLDDLRVPKRADKTANAFQLLRDWLANSENGKWLLILDNVDDAQYLLEPSSAPEQGTDAAHYGPGQERILDYLPVSSLGSILLTSRTTDSALKIVERKSVIAVEPMGVEHAVELLHRKLDCEHTYEDEEAVELTKFLDFMPLAIDQAAAYISQEWPRCSVQSYLQKLADSDGSKSSLLNIDEGDLRRDKEATNSIISTWQISFERIRSIRPSASDLLSLMSFFDRQSIPEAVLQQHRTLGRVKDDASETVTDDFDLDIRLLRSYSFISAATADTFTLHSLVQFATRKWLQARSAENSWNEQFITVLDLAFPEECGYGDWSTCDVLYPHIKIAQSLKPTDRDASRTWASLLYRCAKYAYDRFMIADSRTMVILSRDVFTELEGQRSESAFQCMMFIEETCEHSRSSDTAGELAAELLAISKDLYGRDSATTAECKGLLALSYLEKERLDDAETLRAEMMATLSQLQGDDRAALAVMSSVAETYRAQLLFEKAADLGERVLEVRRRVCGPRHPATIGSMAMLASIYTGSDMFEKARPLHAQIFEIKTQLLGATHPETLESMDDVAWTFQLRQSHDKGISLLAQALEIRKKVLGPAHSSTLNNMLSLSTMYWQQDSYGEAIELRAEAFETSKTAFGPEHPTTLEKMRELSSMYLHAGSYDTAIELGSKAFETSKRVLGPEHQETLYAMANLAESLQAADQWQSASDFMNFCAAKSLHQFGSTHPQAVEWQQLAREWRFSLFESKKKRFPEWFGWRSSRFVR
jgi:tetratricopeptide (TPR) repeat protein